MGPSPYQTSKHSSKIMQRFAQTLTKYPIERPADRRSWESIAAGWVLVAYAGNDPNSLVIPFSTPCSPGLTADYSYRRLCNCQWGLLTLPGRKRICSRG